MSEAPVQAPKPKKFDSYQPETYKTDEMKKEELLSAMTKKLDISDKPLPQDLTEGVEDDEWVSYITNIHILSVLASYFIKPKR